MKIPLTLLFLTISFNSLSQQTIILKSEKKLTIAPIFKMQDSLYFYKGEKRDTVFKLSTALIASQPDNVPDIKRINPDYYFVKFKNQQLAGIWMQLLGGLTSTIIYGATGETAALYGGGAVSLIGFIVYMTGYGNLQKYYVVRNAQPYSE